MSQTVIQKQPESLKQEILEGVKTILAGRDCKEERVLTREETAEYLKVNKSTLWNWQKQGVLVPYGLGSRVYYKLSDILNSLVRLSSEEKEGGVLNA